MKKLFTIAAALLVSFSLLAGTETTTNTGTKDNAVVGTSFTIPGAYVAGAGGAQISPMPNKGIKVRINTAIEGEPENSLKVTVNEGYKITSIQLVGVTNTNDKAAKLGSILVDGVAYTGDFSKDLPAKNASAASNINLTGLNATKSIVYVFSDLGGATQANITLSINYEITAAVYKVTYKANNGSSEADVVDNAAMKVKDCPFFTTDKYFVGWNTSADGKGTPYAVGDAVNNELVLFAQWKDFTAQASLRIASEGPTPAANAEVALVTGSNGGKIYFAGAKEGKYDESFVYKTTGIQLSKGGADSLRVVLTNNLKAGSIIRVSLVALNDGVCAINIVGGGKTHPVGVEAATKDQAYDLYYEVEAEDGLDGSNKIILQRGSSSVILAGVAVANWGQATAIDNATVGSNKVIKTIENGQLVIIKNGVKYNVMGAELR